MYIQTDHGGSDLGRRIWQHRRQAGLTREEAAARARMEPGYLRYLETSPAPSPTQDGLIRLAAALGTSARALTGGGLDLSADLRPSADEHQHVG